MFGADLRRQEIVIKVYDKCYDETAYDDDVEVFCAKAECDSADCDKNEINDPNNA